MKLEVSKTVFDTGYWLFWHASYLKLLNTTLSRRSYFVSCTSEHIPSPLPWDRSVCVCFLPQCN